MKVPGCHNQVVLFVSVPLATDADILACHRSASGDLAALRTLLVWPPLTLRKSSVLTQRVEDKMHFSVRLSISVLSEFIENEGDKPDEKMSLKSLLNSFYRP